MTEEAIKKIIDNNKKNMKLVIATPFYEVKAYSPYVVSLVESIRALNEMGIAWDYYELSGDSYVDRAKNNLVNRFMKSNFTHILMIDSDMAWKVDGFLRVIKAALVGFPLVGAAYPCKNVWEFFGCIPNPHGINKDEIQYAEVGDIKLIDMWCIPGGFICYSRKAFEMVQDKVNKYVERVAGEDLKEIPDYVHEYFKCNIENVHDRVGEDVYFQLRYKEAGGKIYVEPDVDIIHWGVKGWYGNYKRHLFDKESSREHEGYSGFCSDRGCGIQQEQAAG